MAMVVAESADQSASLAPCAFRTNRTRDASSERGGASPAEAEEALPPEEIARAKSGQNSASSVSTGRLYSKAMARRCSALRRGMPDRNSRIEISPATMTPAATASPVQRGATRGRKHNNTAPVSTGRAPSSSARKLWPGSTLQPQEMMARPMNAALAGATHDRDIAAKTGPRLLHPASATAEASTITAASTRMTGAERLASAMATGIAATRRAAPAARRPTAAARASLSRWARPESLAVVVMSAKAAQGARRSAADGKRGAQRPRSTPRFFISSTTRCPIRVATSLVQASVTVATSLSTCGKAAVYFTPAGL